MSYDICEKCKKPTFRCECGTESPEVNALRNELEMTANKLADCWLFIDTAARLQDGSSIDIVRKSAARLLRKQQAPGWK